MPSTPPTGVLQLPDGAVATRPERGSPPIVAPAARSGVVVTADVTALRHRAVATTETTEKWRAVQPVPVPRRPRGVTAASPSEAYAARLVAG